MKTCQKRFTSSAASHRDLLLGAFLNTLYVEVLISSQCEPWKLAQLERKIKQLQVRSVDNGQKSTKLWISLVHGQQVETHLYYSSNVRLLDWRTYSNQIVLQTPEFTTTN